jgi:hypothetical protein
MLKKKKVLEIFLRLLILFADIESIYKPTGQGRAGRNKMFMWQYQDRAGQKKVPCDGLWLALNAMINNSDYFQILCKVLDYSFEEQLKRTAMDTIWGGEVQIQALSIALSHPIYSYIQFNSNPENRHYISSNINLQELVDRFIKGTAGGHLKYIGYKSDMNKLGFCIYYNGTHYDALLPFQDNPQQFVPHFDLINMSL